LEVVGGNSDRAKRLSCTESKEDGWEKPQRNQQTTDKKKLGKLAKHTRKRAGRVASDKAQKEKTRRWSAKKRDKDGGVDAKGGNKSKVEESKMPMR
jgi:hypothetical protein